MSVLDRAALEESPLADLHALASELSIDGYRRLRRPELIDAILARLGGGEPGALESDGSASETDGMERMDMAAPEGESGAAASESESESESEAVESDSEPEPESSLGAEGAVVVEMADGAEDVDPEELAEVVAEELRADDGERAPARRRRGRRGGRGRSGARESAPSSDEEEEAEAEADEAEQAPRSEEESEEPAREEEIVSGVVELLQGGSGFLRVQPPDPSDDDVYISAAQVKRCELVSGDEISGPRRAPRRSERFASMIRIDTINGLPAAEVADAARFDDLPAAYPDDRFRLGSEDPTIKAIEWLTPFGRGSRVAIVGPARAGKSEAALRLARTIAEVDGIQLSVVLAGVRPEEIAEWSRGPVQPAAAVSFGASADAQSQAVERVIEQARRLAGRGANAVVVIDTLDGLHPNLARKVMASARNLVDGGSLTVIATSTTAVGGETTVIALDPALTSTGRFPALDLVASGTIRPELLVGEAGAQAIASARTDALEARGGT